MFAHLREVVGDQRVGGGRAGGLSGTDAHAGEGELRDLIYQGNTWEVE